MEYQEGEISITNAQASIQLDNKFIFFQVAI